MIKHTNTYYFWSPPLQLLQDTCNNLPSSSNKILCFLHYLLWFSFYHNAVQFSYNFLNRILFLLFYFWCLMPLYSSGFFPHHNDYNFFRASNAHITESLGYIAHPKKWRITSSFSESKLSSFELIQLFLMSNINNSIMY